MLNFYQNLKLRKSQVEALLNRLARHWERGFETRCELLAISAVVHSDETSWSIRSVWAFLSENAQVMLFGVRKDAETLALRPGPRDVFRHPGPHSSGIAHPTGALRHRSTRTVGTGVGPRGLARREPVPSQRPACRSSSDIPQPSASRRLVPSSPP
ncbi:hypothetical protein FJY94_08360, partial [Candidatus Kaiserbacteria bacterium]|nr:hypothetical protein [Candidatus Kaiserbacteria bacterium]